MILERGTLKLSKYKGKSMMIRNAIGKLPSWMYNLM